MLGGGAWALLWLARLPCLPVELGLIPTAPVAAPAPVVVAAPPRPASPPLPAPLSMNETARYRIDYGVLNIGELRLTVAGGARGASVVHAGGSGEGAILGLGRMQNRIDADFDARRLDSRRWTSARSNGDTLIRDTGDQPLQGQIDLVRERPGGGTERRQAVVMGPTLDPVGFLLRLRVSPPAASGAPQILYILDGQALWRVTVTHAGREPLPDSAIPIPALRLAAQADPIHYDGSPVTDGDRTQRRFTLWLTDDPGHVPLRLEMPLGIADLVVALVDLDRRPPTSPN